MNKILQVVSPGQAVWKPTPMPVLVSGEVLVQIEAIATCPHWDMHVFRGKPMFGNTPFEYPFIPGQPGHEAIGVVQEVADTDSPFKPGDRVAAWRDPGGRRQGLYAAYAPIQTDDLIAIPTALPAKAIASLELAMCVQVSFDQLRSAGYLSGKRIGISGLGPAGLIAIQLARAYGAAEVIGFDIVPERFDLAKTLGATACMHPEAFTGIRHQAQALDIALDTSGKKQAIEFLMRHTNQTVAIFGVLREDVLFGPANWYGGFSLMGYGRHNREAATSALDHILKGHLDLTPLISKEMSFDEYAKAIPLLESKKAIKILFRP